MIAAILFNQTNHINDQIAVASITRIILLKNNAATNQNISQAKQAMINNITKSIHVNFSLLSLLAFNCDVACTIAQNNIIHHIIIYSLYP